MILPPLIRPVGFPYVQVFYFRGSGIRQFWYAPPGISMVQINCLGGGGGGGGGFSAAAGNTRGGGGAGPGSTWASTLIPKVLLPDKLAIQIGQGGTGGDPATIATNNATGSAVYSAKTNPGTTVGTIVEIATSPGPGNAGTAAGGGATRAAPGATTIDDYQSMGVARTLSGTTGIAGGAHTGAVGGSFTILAARISHQGASGAGVGADDVGFEGGGMVGSSYIPSIAGGAAGGGHGSDGIASWGTLFDSNGSFPMYFTGGLGGGSNGTGVGGNGGNGSYGCGGGGGGGGTTGGRGGNGGNGLVIIWCW